MTSIVTTAHRLLRTKRFLKDTIGRVPFKPIGMTINRQSVLCDEDVLHQLWRATAPLNCRSILGNAQLREAVHALIDEDQAVPLHEFPILSLQGVTATKGYDASSLEALGKSLLTGEQLIRSNLGNDRRMIHFESDADFAQNILWLDKPGIGTRVGPPFAVVHRSWDDRYFLRNGNGSHHLAAIYRQVKEQKRSFTLNGTLTRLTINRRRRDYILEQCYPLIMGKDVARSLAAKLRPLDLVSDVSWLALRLDVADIILKPFSRNEHAVLYLGRDSRRADAAYALIKDLSPAGSVFDLWTYLKDLPAE